MAEVSYQCMQAPRSSALCGLVSAGARTGRIPYAAVAASMHSARKEAQQMKLLEALNQGPVVRGVAKEIPVTPKEVTSDFYSVY